MLITSLKESFLSAQLLDRWREGVALGDTAHIDSSFNFEEALITPFSSPGVLYQPVVHTVFSSVTDGHNSMIDVSRTIFACVRGINSTCVGTEPINDLECNRDRTVCVNGLFQFVLVSFSDIDWSSLDSKRESAWFDCTVSIHGIIRICSFSADSSGIRDILKGMGWKTTVASVVIEVTGAIN